MHWNNPETPVGHFVNSTVFMFAFAFFGCLLAYLIMSLLEWEWVQLHRHTLTWTVRACGGIALLHGVVCTAKFVVRRRRERRAS